MDNKLFYGLLSYFEHLGNFGYMKYSTVYNLVTYIWLAELMENSCNMLTDETKARIQDKMTCLESKLCMLPKELHCNWRIAINTNTKENICV